ncbi:type II toxin-antitoxin system RelE/ParE family toxin [Aquibium carbonis]|uniref:Type II toxin-antitoxin system RelE/ParE family toxin n=1 Tax=Aquibium carbonis TaxID=2495581 RepID=A0A3R9XX30_9HYPH|nr:type II toxin-antitoxin system RelE/ParE family toxin [Aquibium carbonis]
MRIEWHPDAVLDLTRLGTAEQRRIKAALDDLLAASDARQRLVPYSGHLKGHWKLRVGDHRLVCRVEDRDGQRVLVIYVAHRSRAYDSRSVRTILSRTED